MFERYAEWKRGKEAARSERLRKKNEQKPPNHKGWGTMVNNQGIPNLGRERATNIHDEIGARKATAEQISQNQKASTKDGWE